ncbi:Phage repressor protein C, contains Cro/C1-type HTH and peptisase s24 domains [Halomonas shengliensis]|uniref:Phage repressor protein C, contains Cro/C1-type HTH and peptisase s24 domains n=2 Tax=Halomonas shengliensis TaxID=419597 RepID=A0A1H0LTV4_9GAMM|nr:helix-turn-helix transcriptional regulator [Halomonas shengliensis]SDO71622.1 Phage repressor protein C, contains Cro/C1-type HTH and peptisase s24 domains [Halomonas shengliensis]
MSIGERVRRARKHAKLTQTELGKAVGLKQATISDLEKGDSRSSAYLVQIAHACKVDPHWLATGEGQMESNVSEMRPRRAVESNAEMVDVEIVEGDEPLRPDEVWLPIYREVEFAAGNGATQVIENHGAQERFSLPRLARSGVSPENAALAVAKGDSMTPAIQDGATIGIDKGSRTIQDGQVYALDHDGMLRIKRLYRLPPGRMRVVSENTAEYPEEIYHTNDPEAPRILGRVFWVENFL